MNCTNEDMMRLREQLNDLRAANVPIFDLTGIFQHTSETVYIDTCCHINSRGNEIMGKEIVQVISRYYREADGSLLGSKTRPGTNFNPR